MIHRTAGEGGGYLSMTCLICLVGVMICIFSHEEFIYIGCLRIVLIFVILTIAPVISESLLGNNCVTVTILKNVWAPFHKKTSTISLTLFLGSLYLILTFIVSHINLLHTTY